MRATQIKTQETAGSWERAAAGQITAPGRPRQGGVPDAPCRSRSPRRALAAARGGAAGRPAGTVPGVRPGGHDARTGVFSRTCVTPAVAAAVLHGDKYTTLLGWCRGRAGSRSSGCRAGRPACLVPSRLVASVVVVAVLLLLLLAEPSGCYPGTRGYAPGLCFVSRRAVASGGAPLHRSPQGGRAEAEQAAMPWHGIGMPSPGMRDVDKSRVRWCLSGLWSPRPTCAALLCCAPWSPRQVQGTPDARPRLTAGYCVQSASLHASCVHFRARGPQGTGLPGRGSHSHFLHDGPRCRKSHGHGGVHLCRPSETCTVVPDRDGDT